MNPFEFVNNNSFDNADVPDSVDKASDVVKSKNVGIKDNTFSQKLKDQICDALGFATERLKNEIDRYNAYNKGVIDDLEKNEVDRSLIQKVKNKRDALLEENNLLMPKDEFIKFFSSQLRQPLNIAECYLVGAINAIKNSPHFEIMCRSSIKKLDNGSWQVKLPLLSNDGEIITIDPDEILPQSQNNHNGWMSFIGRNMSRGADGLQVLEAAYMKKKFGKIDKKVVEFGMSQEAMMMIGGNNFLNFSFGKGYIIGDNNKINAVSLNEISDKDKVYVDEFLNNYDPELYIATASVCTEKIYNFPKIKGTLNYFLPGHTYTILEVNSSEKTLVLSNPLYPSRRHKLTFNQFKETFTFIRGIRINHKQLLENMNNI